MQEEPPYRRQNLVNNWRLRKGDLDVTRDAAGYVNSATARHETILSYLVGGLADFPIDTPVLDYSNVSAAATYAMWQNAFAKPFFAEPRKLYLIELLGGTSNGAWDETAYRMLLRRIGRYDQSVIERAITVKVTKDNLAQVYEVRHKFVPPFQRLGIIIETIEKEISDIRETEQ